jgi:hypothetical protein
VSATEEGATTQADDAAVVAEVLLQQGCQIILGTIYQNGKICYKWPKNIPNFNKIYQTEIKYPIC